MIVIGLPHFGLVDPAWYDAYEALEKPRKADGSPDWMPMTLHRTIIDHARNLIVRRALGIDRPAEVRNPEPGEVDWIFFLDDDVLPPPDALTRLLAHRAPIVAGSYMHRVWPHYPTAQQSIIINGVTRYAPIITVLPGLQEVAAVGAGCLLIHRSVFGAMPQPWFDFQETADPENVAGEDIHFCHKARQLGFSILLDGDVQCRHLAKTAIGLKHWEMAWATGSPDIRILHGLDLTQVPPPCPVHPVKLVA